MAVTLSDIAEKAGCSINTVSRVMRGDTRISKATCKKVNDIVESLGYVPNYAASSMRSKETHILGVLSADSSNPFFAELILGIEETARKNGYHILLMNTEESQQNECEALRTLTGRHVDGLISIPLYNNKETTQLYQNLPMPFIFAGRKVLGLENHSILHKDNESTREIVQYLVDSGHSRILYITGPESISNSLDRLTGYMTALKENNIVPDKSLIIETKGHIDDGYSALNQALKLQKGFTAVVCFNDLIAMGALKALYENDLSVPEDIEVFGFDNLDISQYMQPRLSTVDVPKYRLGEEAVNELLRHIKDRDLPYETKILDTRLVFRESTKRTHRFMKKK
ncbi:MAG: LacI family transcriptional regulator [Treponema sp.]|nr:LacI family transcriptional regulator [Treponema sp.]